MGDVVQVDHIKTLQQKKNEGLEEVREFTQIIDPTISRYLQLLNEISQTSLNFSLINILSLERRCVKSQQIDIGSCTLPSSHSQKPRRTGKRWLPDVLCCSTIESFSRQRASDIPSVWVQWTARRVWNKFQQYWREREKSPSQNIYS